MQYIWKGNEKMSEKYYVEVLTSLSPEMQDIMMELEKDAFPGIGAVDEQTLVPIARFGKLIVYRETGDPRPIAVCELMREYNAPQRAYVFGYYVRSDQQGKGIGQKFFAEVMNIIDKDGFDEICLTVDVSNTPAVKVYEKLGFEIKETREAEYGKGEDRYYMEWRKTN